MSKLLDSGQTGHHDSWLRIMNLKRNKDGVVVCILHAESLVLVEENLKSCPQCWKTYERKVIVEKVIWYNNYGVHL